MSRLGIVKYALECNTIQQKIDFTSQSVKIANRSALFNAVENTIIVDVVDCFGVLDASFFIWRIAKSFLKASSAADAKKQDLVAIKE